MGSFNLLSFLLFLIPVGLFSQTTILLIGDSNTRGIPYVEDGWAYKLKNDPELQSYNLTFENYGFGYASSSQCEQLLTELLQHHKYDIVFYNVGLVDVLFKDISLHLFELCMDRSLALCVKHIPVVFFGMIDFTCWTIRKNSDPSYISEANEIYVRMANKYPVIPYEFLTTDLLCHEKCNIGDWVHPNDLGKHIIYLNIKKELLKVLREDGSIKFDILSEFIL